MDTLIYYSMIGAFIIIVVILGIIYDSLCHRLYNIKTRAYELCQKQLDIMYEQKEFGYYSDIKYIFNLNMVNSRKRAHLIEEIEKTGLFYLYSSADLDVIFLPTKKANETLLNRYNKDCRE